MTCFDQLPAGDTDAAQISSADSDANSKRTVGVVTTVIGGAALLTGVTLLVIDMSGQHHESTAMRRLQPVLGLDYAGLAGTF